MRSLRLSVKLQSAKSLRTGVQFCCEWSRGDCDALMGALPEGRDNASKRGQEESKYVDDWRRGVSCEVALQAALRMQPQVVTIGRNLHEPDVTTPSGQPVAVKSGSPAGMQNSWVVQDTDSSTLEGARVGCIATAKLPIVLFGQPATPAPGWRRYAVLAVVPKGGEVLVGAPVSQRLKTKLVIYEDDLPHEYRRGQWICENFTTWRATGDEA